jgi:hypothetical protein
MIDYMYAKAGIKYTFTAHLRDTGTVRALTLVDGVSIDNHHTVRVLVASRMDKASWGRNDQNGGVSSEVYSAA